MLIPHAQLGQIGVVGDQNGQALPLNAWTNSLNVRFTPLGIEKIAESTLRIESDNNLEVFTTKRYRNQAYVFAASSSGLHMYEPENGWRFKAMPVAGESPWNFCHWGDTVIFNNFEYAPQMWDWDEDDFVDLPKWGIISTEYDLTKGEDPSFDTELRCQRLLAYKSQLVAIGIKHKDPIDAELDPTDVENWPEDLVYEKTEYLEKDNVVWVSNTTSDPTYKVPEGEPGGGADSGVTGLMAGGPPSWDYISPATLSVHQVVGASDGKYVAAELLNESIIIYTVTAAHALVFTGGQYVVQTRRLFQRGCAGHRSLCEFGNQHFVIDHDAIYVHDGSQATRLGEDMFDVQFFERSNDLDTASVAHDPENKEIWMYFDTNYGRKGAVYNYQTGTFGWADGEALKEPIKMSSRGFLPRTGAQWGDIKTAWYETLGSWEDQTQFTIAPDMLLLTSLGLHQREAFYSKDRDAFVERIGMDFDDAGINNWVMKHLKQYHLQITGDGEATIRFGWSQSPMGMPAWEKPIQIDDQGDGSYQVDVRTTGRVLSMRVELRKMGQMRWSSSAFNVEPTGQR
jgi:hypothetical protein